jgi:hypothetical protein
MVNEVVEVGSHSFGDENGGGILLKPWDCPFVDVVFAWSYCAELLLAESFFFFF